MAGWLSRRGNKRWITPKDEIQYYIPQEIIDFTVGILLEYGNQYPPSEGIVYWAGLRHKNEWQICAAIAPAVEASRYGFQTGYNSNAQFVSFICDHDLQYVCQVHSHPATWVDHSSVDDKETAFRSEGLLSIVVPTFGRSGIFPLKQCGVHIHTKGSFKRLTNKYLGSHFHTSQPYPLPIILKDFRHE